MSTATRSTADAGPEGVDSAQRPAVDQPHSQAVEAVAAALDVEPQSGLSSEEAAARLERYGPNALREAEPPSLLEMLARQFDDFVIWLLIAAAVIAAAVSYAQGESYVDSIAIVAIVVLNAAVGVIQERRAENALRALKALAAPDANVIRDGHHRTVPAREVVPGDVVVLEAGNYVPADLRLREDANLRIDEAPLTGESVPVRKNADETLASDTGRGDQVNMAFRGTVVSYGRGSGIVTTTGMRTALGEIAELIHSYEREPTPLQERLDGLGHTLGKITLVVSAIVFAVGLARAPEVTLDAVLDLFMVAVSLAIAAVPEGLPAVVTVALAIGMQRMIRRNALVRRLPAVETLGSATTICSDKTGTLTQNEMMVVQAEIEGETLRVAGEGYDPHGKVLRDGDEIDPTADPNLRLLAAGATLASDAVLEQEDGRWRVVGDPTEGALVAFAARAGIDRGELEEELPRVSEIPFESGRKRMTTIHRVPDASELPVRGLEDGGVLAFVKGAPDIVLELCDRYQHDGRADPIDDDLRARVEAANADMAGRALRVLALAYRVLDEVPEEPTADEVEHDLVLVGLVGMIDPPRPEVGQAIARARRAGVRTIMVTGDYPDTARAIATELDLMRPGSEVLTGRQVEAMDDTALREQMDEVDVFARVSPEHKVRIVEALKDRGAIVAMTGDGVNDAPALKRAHIGVAMGQTGTDVSRETADMVLTDDNYASIVAAIEEGRTIYTNIRKFVFFLLSCNIGEIIIIFTAMLFALASEPPLLPIHLLWLNLVTDGLPALALGLEPSEPDVMERPPRDPDEPILARSLWPLIGVQAVVDAAATLAAFMWAYDGPETLRFAQTVALATLVTAELLRAYTSRSQERSILEIGVLSNRWMVLATLSSFLLLLAVIYIPIIRPVFETVPLGLATWRPILGFAVLPALAAEVTKALLRRGGPPGAERQPARHAHDDRPTEVSAGASA